MTTTEHPVRQLLWCALNALKTAQENHNITSETGLRHYLLEWLSGASRHPEFRSLPGEIMALKALTEKDRNIPIIGTLNTLFLSSATVGECPLFRFRAALGKLQKAGWCVFRSIRSRIGIEVRSAIRIHSINRELNFFYRFLTRFFAAFHYRGIFPQ
uniref:Conjugal transfer protein TraC n=1 Tax=Escherichia coli TaxID=562 RepID=A0A6D1P3C4_ECOLX|nr:hypothetical protein [Escherichia coli]QHV89972.1 hypothetical protein CKBILEBI_00046 [Escherichia coli]